MGKARFEPCAFCGASVPVSGYLMTVSCDACHERLRPKCRTCGTALANSPTGAYCYTCGFADPGEDCKRCGRTWVDPAKHLRPDGAPCWAAKEG